jgi:glycosyltransferase involved in cell wall biosynthesis
MPSDDRSPTPAMPDVRARSRDPLRVLVPIGASALGGGELALLRFLEATPRDEVAFRCWLFAPGPLCAEMDARGIPWRILPRAWLRTPWGFARLQRELRRESPAVVYLHGSRVIALAARLDRIPCLERMNMPRVRGAGGWCRFRLLDRFFSNLNTRVLPVSEALAGELRARGVDARRIVVLRDFIDPARFHRPDLRAAARAELGIPDDACVVLNAGRMVPQKAQADFLAVAQHVGARFPAAHFVLAGDGPLRGAIEARASGLHLGERLHILPFRGDPAALFALADVYVQTARWEGLAAVIHEAMAARLGIVATDVGGTREALLPHPQHRLVPAGDVEALARALEELIGSRAHGAAVAAPPEFARAAACAHFVALLREAAGETMAAARRAAIVVLANDPWNSQWRRKQRLYSHLARTRTVYYLDPPFPALDLLRAPLAHARIPRSPRITRDASGVHVVRGAIGIPAERFLGRVRLLNARRQRAWARACLRHLDHAHGVHEPIVICYEPLLHPVRPLGAMRRLIYDVIDDYGEIAPSAIVRARSRARMEALAAESDLTLVVHDALRRRLEGHARELMILPHAADNEVFHPCADRGTRFAALREAGGIKAVFHGTLDERLDPRILTALLASGVTLLLAGECAWPQRVRRALRAAGDLRMLGPLSPAEAAALVAACDVGVLPYRRGRGMEGVGVLKRLEFYAAGLPVVATEAPPADMTAPALAQGMPGTSPVPGATGSQDGVLCAHTPDEFVQAVRRAAHADPEARARLVEIARANAWDERARQLEARLPE